MINPKVIAVVTIFAFVCLPVNSINAALKDIEKKFSSSKAFPYYEKGNNYLKEGRSDEAIGEYVEAVKLEPDYYGLYSKIGHALYCSGRFEESLSYFRKSFGLNRGNVDTMMGMANAYMALKQEPEARYYFEKVMEISPDNPAPHMPLALIYNHKNMLAESMDLLNKVLKNYPMYDSAYFLLALDHELLIEFDPAIENYKKGLEITPGYVKAYLGLARCYMLKGKYNRSYNYAKIANRLRPDLEEAGDIISSLKKIFRADKQARDKKKAMGEKASGKKKQAARK